MTGVQSGRVIVGAMHTMGPIDVSLALATFHERFPGVELTVREQSAEELAEMLRVDELDLAFLSVTERIESHGLGLHQLVSEELVAVLPRSHRLAARRRVRMAELAEEQFISFREGARLRELLIVAGRQAGYEPRVKLESNEANGCASSYPGASAWPSSRAPMRRVRAPTSRSPTSPIPPSHATSRSPGA